MKNTQKKKKKNRAGRRNSAWIALVVAVMLGLSGCGQVIDLTDEENHLIAEYAAELLLKYDRNYDTKYDPEEATTEATPTEATTQETTTEAVTEATTEMTTETAVEATTEAQVSSEESVTEEITTTVADDFDIAAFVGENRISVRYAYNMVVDSYPSYDEDGRYIEVEAPEGYKMLVLKFEVENKTNEDQKIDLYSKDINYNIIVDNTRKTKQMLTILQDDLYTYNKTIAASSREETVLLYTVSDSVANNMKDLKLLIQYGGASAVIQLNQ